MGIFSNLGKVFSPKKAEQPLATAPAASPRPPVSAAPKPRPSVPAPQMNGSSARQAAAVPRAASGGGTAVATPIMEDDSIDLGIDDDMSSGNRGASRGPSRSPSAEGVVEAKPNGYASSQQLAPAPRNRNELFQELQKNYNEVLSLVRKVDHHLDQQQHRQVRLLEIAEQTHKQMSVLTDLRDQNARAADAITELTAVTKAGQKSTDNRLGEQTRVLGDMKSVIQATAEHEKEISHSLDAFRNSMGGMADATGRLGEALAGMRAADVEREEQIAKMITRQQRFMIIAIGLIVVVCGGALAAITLAL